MVAQPTSRSKRAASWTHPVRPGIGVVSVGLPLDIVAYSFCSVSSNREPSKFEIARRVGAAIGYMVMSGSQRAQIFAVAETVKSVSRSARGRGGLASFLKSLEALKPGGATNLGKAIDAVSQRSARPGTTVDVTMDPAALEADMLRFTGLCEELRAFARKHGAGYLRMRTDEALEPVERRFVARTVD